MAVISRLRPFNLTAARRRNDSSVVATIALLGADCGVSRAFCGAENSAQSRLQRWTKPGAAGSRRLRSSGQATAGSGVVWRRRALDDIGDFPAWNLVEDLQSGVEALRRAWRGAYVTIIGAVGQTARPIRVPRRRELPGRAYINGR